MKGTSRAMVDPVERDRKLVEKYSWKKTRKAVRDNKAPVPQTDTGG